MFFGFFFPLRAGYCMPAMSPLPPWSTNKGVSQENSICTGMHWRAKGTKNPPTFCPFHSEIQYLISKVWYLQVAIYYSNHVSSPRYICILFSLQRLCLHSSQRPNCDFSQQCYCEVSSLFHLRAQTDVSVLLTLTLTWLWEEISKVIHSSRPPTAPHQWWACPGEPPPRI